MKHRIMALCLAVMMALSVVVGSVTAFAATDESSGSDFLDDYFSDWEEAGEQAKILRDQYKQFLYNICTQQGLEKILGDAKEIPIAWLRTTKAGVFAISPVDNIYYWLVNGQLVFDDRSSGESVKKTVDPSSPSIYVPSPWVEYVNKSGDSSGSKDLGGIIGNISTGVGGVFSMSKSGFDFITGNDICMFMVAISFAGVGLGLIGRAFKTSRK